MNAAQAHTQTAAPRGRRGLLLGAIAMLVAVAGLATMLWPGPAESSTSEVRVLGQLPDRPSPACPATDREACMAVGNVTILQSQAGDVRMPYRVPFHGRLVSWSITLAEPEPSEVRGFNDFYGRPAQARVAVLRPVRRRPPIFKMVRQTPVQDLTRYFGRTVHFALERPLVVRRGHVIALTIPTWAPNWAIDLSDGNSWRASRNRNRCADSDIEEHSRPQQRVRSNRQYGCYFTNTRFLYTATVASDPDA